MRFSKKILSVFICLTLIISSFTGVVFFTASSVGTEAAGKRDLEYGITYWYSNVGVSGYTSGTGSPSDPYIITTAAQLRHLVRGDANSAGKYYKLGNDIVINDTSDENWYEGSGLKNWIKGSDSTYGTFSDTRNYREMGGDLFRGHFDGAGYTISGLYIDYNGTGRMSGSSTSRVYCGWGLFPLVYGATFENVKLKDVYIKSNVIANVTAEYHGYGALVGNVHGDQHTTFTNVQVENIKFDLARPGLTGTSKPVGIGGIMGYSYGNLTVTDAVVKNVSANIKNYYATSRNAAYVGGIVGAMGWGKTANLTNVLTIGAMNPFSASSASSGGAVTIASGNWIQDIKNNQSINIVATNCYSIGAEKIISGANITKVSDRTAFINENLDDFYNNIGTSNNWTNKVKGAFPQLKAFRPDTVMVVLPTNEIIDIKCKSGEKLADIVVNVDGYSDNGKWYDDYDCTVLSAEEYPVAGKLYYRNWSKYIKIDFEKDYHYTNGYPAYPDPHDPNFSDAKYHTRSDVKRVVSRNGSRVLQLTYSNDNPVYTAAGFNYGPGGEFFHNYKMSPYIWLIDTATNTVFKGSPDFKYTISFDYEIEGPLPEEDVAFYLYLTKDTVSSHDAAVNGLKNNDNILAGKFDVNVANGSKGTTALEFTAVMGYVPRIVMVTNDGMRLAEDPEVYHSAYIDNVTISEEIPAGKTAVSVSFNSDGGLSVSGFRVLKNNQIGKLPTPTKSGYLFDCWYLADDAKQTEVNPSYVATTSLNLKAKWVSVKKSNYDSAGFEDFDNLRYPNVIDDYSNLDMSTLYQNGIVDSTMTAANRYIKENCPDGMSAALLLSNSPAAMSNAGAGLPATVLLNSDGTKFTVKSGTVYKIEYDYLPLGASNAHSYIGVKYGAYTADSINGSSALGVEKVAVHGLNNEKTTVTQYFKASSDGFVFFTLGSRQNFEHFVLIDNVKITVSDNAKSITFKDADTDKVVDARPVGFGYHIQYGMPGDTIREFAINTQSGKQIQGFYNDKACTIPCTDYNVITDKDRVVYVKMKNADYSKISNFDNPIVLDFETSEEFDLEIFYRYMPYMSWTSTEIDNIVDYRGDDSKNAFDGSGYVRIKDYEFAYGEKGHSFVLYDKNNASGLMILAPNTTYRITAQAKYEDDAKIPSLKIWTVKLTDFSYTRLSTTLTSTNEDMVGYDEISGLVTTADDPVAVAIGGVYLAEQNVYIDNVTVEKMTEKTISFVTNGGDPVEDIMVLPYSDLSSYDPGFAFKVGYEFVGWFLDKNFTKPFDFLKDVVTEDITLYAKFVEEVLDEETEVDTEINVEEEKKGFGENLTIADADKIVKADIEVNNSGVIWIILASALGVLVLSGTIILVIILVKRKKR